MVVGVLYGNKHNDGQDCIFGFVCSSVVLGGLYSTDISGRA